MDRLFSEIFGPTPRWIDEAGGFAPTMGLYETGEEVVVQAYLPGTSREEIHVEVVWDTVHLFGESKPSVPEKNVIVHLAQGNYGKFDVRYRLPVTVNSEQAKATYRNGVLEIRLPKQEAAEPKKVEVRIEG